MFRYLGLLILLVSCKAVHAGEGGLSCDDWPLGMTFVGLTASGWQTFAVTGEGREPQQLSLDAEARTPQYLSKTNSIIYINEGGQLMRASLAGNGVVMDMQTVLSPTEQASYAQPEFDAQKNVIFVVELKQGKSVDTDIIQINSDSHKRDPVIIQRSAQFEPFVSGEWVYYSNVHCVVGCGKIIQEIWRYHSASGIAEQITLLNSTSRQPTVDRQQEWLYFSSNAAGNYHIYRQSLSDTAPPVLEQLTEGPVTDLSPVIDRGRLYFIRHDARSASLQCLNKQNAGLKNMILDNNIINLRDLEI